MYKQLRILAGEMVVGSKLSKAAKLQMINFIQKEATDAQVKVLLMDGEIVQLDKQAEEIVNDRFDDSEMINELVLMGADIVIGALVAASIVAYKRFLSKAAVACKGLSGPQKTSCMNKFKQNGIKAQIATLASGTSKCAKTKDPAKCKVAIQKKIAKLKAKLGTL